MVTRVGTQAESFPVEWTNPADPGPTYTHDPMHFPFPVSPLTCSTIGPAFSAGFTTAAREMNTPILQVEAIDRNWFHFERYVMRIPANETEAREIGELAEATLKPQLGQLRARWENEHLPALLSRLERLKTMDVDSASPAELTAIIDEVDVIHRDFWTIHFRIAIPMLLGMQIFDEFYADLFGGEDGDSHALLRGVASESVKAGLGLYDLALSARAAGLESTFVSTPSSELQNTLSETEFGRKFLAELQHYLEQYGLRQDLFDLATPTWLEEPSIALASVRNYLQSSRDERAEYVSITRSAEAAVEAARSTLAAYPEAVRGQFEGLLEIGRTASFLQEEHNFYIDQQGLSRIRLLYVAIGRRLEREGTLAEAADIFMLQSDELRAIFALPDAADQIDHIRALVTRRHEELAIAATLSPPPFIGVPPEGPPPSGDPMGRALGRFFGGPPQQSGAANEIKGNAGSRGTVTGVARVARTLEEATHLLQGEILVAVTTMPAWTPLFGIAAAVVTETGGPLSHCAIVAREYGIPAVVGAHGATRMIASGQRISVDGGRGIVTLVE